MKCVDAIDDLIALLTYRFRLTSPMQPPFTASSYPATEALMIIGKPALPALVKLIETHDAACLVSKNARFTVRCIFSYREKEGDEFFRQAADKAATPEAKERLLRALETAREDMRAD
jgi:hypothetical protein